MHFHARFRSTNVFWSELVIKVAVYSTETSARVCGQQTTTTNSETIWWTILWWTYVFPESRKKFNLNCIPKIHYI